MFSVFDDVRQQVRFKKEHPTIESTVFSAMKVAMMATLLSCALVTAKTYIGENINCVTGFSKQEHKAIETYCFISSTFSMVNLSESESPHPGTGPMRLNADVAEDDSLKRHAYYQWVPMFLAIQVAVLYFPRWLWKSVMDKNKFTNVLNHLDVLHIDDNLKLMEERKAMRIGGLATQVQEKREETELEKRLNASAQYMADSLHHHGRYAAMFLLCETLAFIIALGNLFVTNTFLGGAFFTYGSRSLSYITSDVTDMNNPLNEVFPKVAKCTFRKIGPTGSIQSFDAMCVLPLNIVNEKTFILLWVVFIVTFTAVAATLLFHYVLAFAGASFRNTVIKRRLKSPAAKATYGQLQGHLNYGAWFFVYHLSGRMVGPYFEQWIDFVYDALSTKKK